MGSHCGAAEVGDPSLRGLAAGTACNDDGWIVTFARGSWARGSDRHPGHGSGPGGGHASGHSARHGRGDGT